jgi:vacuolar-type H+-ATPase subunit F/Vma7
MPRIYGSLSPSRASRVLASIFASDYSAKILLTGEKGSGKTTVVRDAVSGLECAVLKSASVVCGSYLSPSMIEEYKAIVFVNLLREALKWQVVELSRNALALLANANLCVFSGDTNRLALNIATEVLGELGADRSIIDHAIRYLINCGEAVHKSRPRPAMIEDADPVYFAFLRDVLPLSKLLGVSYTPIIVSAKNWSEVEEAVRNLESNKVYKVILIQLKDSEEIPERLPELPPHTFLVVESSREVERPEVFDYVIEVQRPNVTEWTSKMSEEHGDRWISAVAIALYLLSPKHGSGLLAERLKTGDVYTECTVKDWASTAMLAPNNCKYFEIVYRTVEKASNDLFEDVFEPPLDSFAKVLYSSYVLVHALKTGDNGLFEKSVRVLGLDAVAEAKRAICAMSHQLCWELEEKLREYSRREEKKEEVEEEEGREEEGELPIPIEVEIPSIEEFEVTEPKQEAVLREFELWRKGYRR